MTDRTPREWTILNESRDLDKYCVEVLPPEGHSAETFAQSLYALNKATEVVFSVHCHKEPWGWLVEWTLEKWTGGGVVSVKVWDSKAYVDELLKSVF